MMDIVVVGIPGLYENWLLRLLDPTALVDNEAHDFRAEIKDPRLSLVGKFATLRDNPNFYDTVTDKFVINTYVDPANYVWFMHNFLALSGDDPVDLKKFNLETLRKMKGGEAYGGLYDHLITQYKINEHTPAHVISNAIVETLYLPLASSVNLFRETIGIICQNENSINIEYDDFSSSKKLKSLLDKLPADVDLSAFATHYKLLQAASKNFLSLRKNFAKKIEGIDDVTDLPVLEQAIAGYAIHKLTGLELDWFNSQSRRDLFTYHKADIAKYFA